jgi:hypothetical protein
VIPPPSNLSQTVAYQKVWGMGANASIQGDAFLEILTHEACPSSHPIWQSVSLPAFSSVDLARQIICAVKEKRPENIAELIRFSVSRFSQASFDATPAKAHVSSLCEFISLLLAVTSREDRSAWLTPSRAYLPVQAPVVSLVQSLNRLLRLDQGAEASFKSRIACLKTFLFLIHAECDSAPSPFLLSCDALPGPGFLGASLRIVAAALTEHSKYAARFVRSLVAFIVPCIYACPTWDLGSVDSVDINGAVSPLFQITNPVVSRAFADRLIQCSDELLSLFFVISLKFPVYLEFIVQKKLAMKCITGLLYLFREKCENSIPFSISLILFLLKRMLSIENVASQLNGPLAGNFVGMPEGSFADVMILILTEPLLKGFGESAVVFDLIFLICLGRVSLSSVSANRLVILLKQLWIAKMQIITEIEQLTMAICALLHDELVLNLPLLIFCGDYRRLLKQMIGANIAFAPSDRLLQIIAETESALQTLDESEQKAHLARAQSRILELPVLPRAFVAPFQMTQAIELEWLTWLHGLFARLLPVLTLEFHSDVAARAPPAPAWWLFGMGI